MSFKHFLYILFATSQWLLTEAVYVNKWRSLRSLSYPLQVQGESKILFSKFVSLFFFMQDYTNFLNILLTHLVHTHRLHLSFLMMIYFLPVVMNFLQFSFFFKVRLTFIIVVKDIRPSNFLMSFRLCTKKYGGSTVNNYYTVII